MQKKPIRIKDGQSILIVKISSIGDVVHTLPVLDGLSATFPNSPISWLVGEKASPVLKDCHLLDHTYVVLDTVRGVFRMVRELRSVKFDWVLDFQGTYKSGFFTWVSSGKRRVGYNQTKEPCGLAYNHLVPLSSPSLHAVDKILQLASAVGMQIPSHIEFNIPSSGQNQIRVQKLLEEHGVSLPFIALCPTAGYDSRRWDPLKFHELASRLAAEYGYDVVLIGGPKDFELNEIIRGENSRIFNFSRFVPLKELAILLSKAACLISGDTGPLHFAVSADCPVVALFGASDPSRTGPYRGNNVILTTDLPCRPCLKKTCRYGHKRCLEDITPERVFGTVTGLIPRKIDFPGAVSYT